MGPKLQHVPDIGMELLRFVVVLGGAAIGLTVGRQISGESEVRLGVLNGATLGLVLGAGAGYVLGGVLARAAARAMSRGERALDGMTPDQVVAGTLGALVATALVGLVTWPILLFEPRSLTASILLFLLLSSALFGFRVGLHRRSAVIGRVGSAAGLASPPQAAITRPWIADTSVAIDGRVVDVVRAGFLTGRMLVPLPVLGELQGLADSADDQRRAKGRRGLSILETLRAERGLELETVGDEAPGVPDVDAKLVRMCLDRSAALLTCDVNLARTAALAGVRVLDMHQLAIAMRPPLSVGEEFTVVPRRKGRDPGQAIAHLDDGTMIVVEQAAELLGKPLRIRISSVITTSGGRMAFAAPVAPTRPTARPDSSPGSTSGERLGGAAPGRPDGRPAQP